MRKWNILFLLIPVLSMQLFSSCKKVWGEGPLVTETRNPGNFQGIRMAVSGNVYYKQDATYKLEIQAQRNILDVLETPIINNELVIQFKHDVRARRYEDIIVTITAPAINSLSVSGSGNIKTTGAFTAQDMRLSVSGSGDIQVPQLASNSIDAVISGSGNIFVLGGNTNNEQLSISGSGSIDLLNVPAKSAIVRTSGSGTSKVNASDNLDVNISGSGTVYYKGNPVITVKTSGSGQLVHL